MPLELNVFGHLVGSVGFEPIVDHFQSAASEFAKSVLDGILELPRGFWCDRLKQERLHELVDLLPTSPLDRRTPEKYSLPQLFHRVAEFHPPEQYGKPWPREAYGYRVVPWYMRSRDGGQPWETAGGEPLSLPVTEKSVDILFDFDGPYDIPWSVDVTVDEANRPHVLCVWAYRNPGPELNYREVQSEIQKLPSRIWEMTWGNGRWVRNPVVTPALVDHHVMLPAVVFCGGKLHLAVTTRATAALQRLGASRIRELWHLWGKPGGNWSQEFVAENAEFTNNWKLPDESGELELLWRGAPKSKDAKAAIWYATGLNVSQ